MGFAEFLRFCPSDSIPVGVENYRYVRKLLHQKVLFGALLQQVQSAAGAACLG